MDALVTLKPVHIYGLIDPVSGGLRYIGKSIRPAQRLANHMNEQSNCHRSHWLQSLKRQGLKPELIIIETIHGEWPWQESERFWIKRARELGCLLTNNTSGGDGVSDLPLETRERMRQTWLGRKHKPETIEKLRQASSQHRHSKETRQKMSRAHSGRKITWIDKVAAGLRKIKDTDIPIIIDRLKAGERVKNLAAEYGVHRTTLSKIKTGKYYDQRAKSRAR